MGRIKSKIQIYPYGDVQEKGNDSLHGIKITRWVERVVLSGLDLNQSELASTAISRDKSSSFRLKIIRTQSSSFPLTYGLVKFHILP